MELKIPVGNAIEILQKRMAEISHSDFQPNVWKAKTENDLREIFAVGDLKWLQVSGINFHTYIKSEQASILSESKVQAKQLIASYIEQILKYSKIQQQKEVIEEDNFEKKYHDLSTEWNELVPKYNDLVQEKDTLLGELEIKKEEIDNKDKEVKRVIENTIQLSNISLIKLIRLIFNLPVGQVVAFLVIVATIIGGSFKLGSLVSESASKNEQFELKIENEELKQTIEDQQTKYSELENEFVKQRNDVE